MVQYKVKLMILKMYFSFFTYLNVWTDENSSIYSLIDNFMLVGYLYYKVFDAGSLHG